MKLYRDLVYVFAALLILGIILCILSYTVAFSDYSYLGNVSVFVMAFSAAPLVMSIVIYHDKKYAALQNVYKRAVDVINGLNAYEICPLTADEAEEQEVVTRNIAQLDRICCNHMPKLIGAIDNVAFLFDRYGVKRFLNQFKLYFQDISDDTLAPRIHLRLREKPIPICDIFRCDRTLFDVKYEETDTEYKRTALMKITEDTYDMQILDKLTYSKYPKSKLEFHGMKPLKDVIVSEESVKKSDIGFVPRAFQWYNYCVKHIVADVIAEGLLGSSDSKDKC